MITRVSEFALIACRVSSEKKALVRRLAEREGITESTLVRQLLDVVLRTADLDGPSGLDPPERVNRDGQVHVRLEPGDLQLLRERAKGRGMSSATYLSYLARSHLRRVTPIPKAEYTLLTQAVGELGALARTLKRIDGAIAQANRAAAPGRGEVGAMLKIAEGLRDHIRGLLDDNQRSWRDGYGTTSP